MINGRVDDYGRALVSVKVRHPVSAAVINLDAWIDTGFTGLLFLTQAQIATLGLSKSSTVQGGLADGSVVAFDTYPCQIDWFGRRVHLEAMETPGRFALIGVQLLEDCTLAIDYPARTLTITAQTAPPSSP